MSVVEFRVKQTKKAEEGAPNEVRELHVDNEYHVWGPGWIPSENRQSLSKSLTEFLTYKVRRRVEQYLTNAKCKTRSSSSSLRQNGEFCESVSFEMCMLTRLTIISFVQDDVMAFQKLTQDLGINFVHQKISFEEWSTASLSLPARQTTHHSTGASMVAETMLWRTKLDHERKLTCTAFSLEYLVASASDPRLSSTAEKDNPKSVLPE